MVCVLKRTVAIAPVELKSAAAIEALIPQSDAHDWGRNVVYLCGGTSRKSSIWWALSSTLTSAKCHNIKGQIREMEIWRKGLKHAWRFYHLLLGLNIWQQTTRRPHDWNWLSWNEAGSPSVTASSWISMKRWPELIMSRCSMRSAQKKPDATFVQDSNWVNRFISSVQQYNIASVWTPAKCPHCVHCNAAHSHSSENLFCYIIMQELVFYSGGSAICCSTYPDSNKVKL